MSITTGDRRSRVDEGPEALERRILARSGIRSRDLRGSRSALLDPSTSWFRRWYFLLRLSEELHKARGHDDRPTAVVTIKIPLAAEGLLTCISNRLRERLAHIAGNALRPGDFPGTLTDEELAVCLPATDRRGAEPVIDRLRHELAAFGPSLGLAVYPEDGFTAVDLVHVASIHAASPPGQLIDFEEYRRRRGALTAA